MRKYLAVAALVAALVLGAAGCGGSSGTGSSPERTVYSAVHSLKQLNFGRFCSYLADGYRGPQADCRYRNAVGWGTNAMFFGVDTFEGAHVVAGSRVDVDQDTVKYKVALPAIDAVYWFTVELGASGKWRVTDITAVE